MTGGRNFFLCGEGLAADGADHAVSQTGFGAGGSLAGNGLLDVDAVFFRIAVSGFVLAVSDLIDLVAAENGVCVGADGLTPDLGSDGLNVVAFVVVDFLAHNTGLEQICSLTGGKLFRGQGSSAVDAVGIFAAQVVAVHHGAIVLTHQGVCHGIGVVDLHTTVAHQSTGGIAAGDVDRIGDVAVVDVGVSIACQTAHMISACKVAVGDAQVLDLVVIVGVAEQAHVAALGHGIGTGDGEAVAVEGTGIAATAGADGYPCSGSVAAGIGAVGMEGVAGVQVDVGHQLTGSAVVAVVHIVCEPEKLSCVVDQVGIVPGFIVILAGVDFRRLIAAAGGAEAVIPLADVVITLDLEGFGFGVFLAVHGQSDGVGLAAGVEAVGGFYGSRQLGIAAGGIHIAAAIGAVQSGTHIAGAIIVRIPLVFRHKGGMCVGIQIAVLLTASVADGTDGTGGFATLVSQGLALGSAADSAGLGSGTGGIQPAVNLFFGCRGIDIDHLITGDIAIVDRFTGKAGVSFRYQGLLPHALRGSAVQLPGQFAASKGTFRKIGSRRCGIGCVCHVIAVVGGGSCIGGQITVGGVAVGQRRACAFSGNTTCLSVGVGGGDGDVADRVHIRHGRVMNLTGNNTCTNTLRIFNLSIHNTQILDCSTAIDATEQSGFVSSFHLDREVLDDMIISVKGAGIGCISGLIGIAVCADGFPIVACKVYIRHQLCVGRSVACVDELGKDHQIVRSVDQIHAVFIGGNIVAAAAGTDIVHKIVGFKILIFVTEVIDHDTHTGELVDRLAADHGIAVCAEGLTPGIAQQVGNLAGGKLLGSLGCAVCYITYVIAADGGIVGIAVLYSAGSVRGAVIATAVANNIAVSAAGTVDVGINDKTVFNGAVVNAACDTARNVFARSNGCAFYIAVGHFTVCGNELSHNGTGTDVLTTVNKSKVLDTEIFNCSADCTKQATGRILCCGAGYRYVLDNMAVAVKGAGIAKVCAVRFVIQVCFADGSPSISCKVNVCHQNRISRLIACIDILCEPHKLTRIINLINAIVINSRFKFAAASTNAVFETVGFITSIHIAVHGIFCTAYIVNRTTFQLRIGVSFQCLFPNNTIIGLRAVQKISYLAACKLVCGLLRCARIIGTISRLVVAVGNGNFSGISAEGVAAVCFCGKGTGNITITDRGCTVCPANKTAAAMGAVACNGTDKAAVVNSHGTGAYIGNKTAMGTVTGHTGIDGHSHHTFFDLAGSFTVADQTGSKFLTGRNGAVHR